MFLTAMQIIRRHRIDHEETIQVFKEPILIQTAALCSSQLFAVILSPAWTALALVIRPS